MHYPRPLTVLTSLLGVVLFISSCGDKSSDQSTEQELRLVKSPEFIADSSYHFIEKQVAFGPRVPNSPAHKKCGDFLVQKLRSYDWQVIEQKFVDTAFDGTVLNGRNIIGSYNPTASKRLLLASHWDSRPFADAENATKTTPVPAANDGASGVGVLLEVARIIQQSKPDIGVDIIFFDLEDWGSSQPTKDPYGGFCLGSKYWSKNKHIPGYMAYFGVLLDMVGAKGATFPKEGSSMQFAPDVMNSIWNIASKLGYNQYFIDIPGQAITDDHHPVNQLAGFPMVDIIHLEINNPQRTFFKDWHTVNDNINNIDKATLKAVGQTLTQVVFQETAPVQ